MKDRTKSVADIVKSLFADGKTPCDKYNIDVKKIQEVEQKHPEVAKHANLDR